MGTWTIDIYVISISHANKNILLGLNRREENVLSNFDANFLDYKSNWKP